VSRRWIWKKKREEGVGKRKRGRRRKGEREKRRGQKS